MLTVLVVEYDTDEVVDDVFADAGVPDAVVVGGDVAAFEYVDVDDYDRD